MKGLLFLPLLFLGCVGHLNPPSTYGIDPGFTDNQAAVIKDVFQAWCDKTGYCPSQNDRSFHGFIFISTTSFGESHSCPSGKICFIAGRNYGTHIAISDKLLALGPDQLWLHVAHEVGHYCNKAHSKSGIMAPYHKGVDVQLVIDDQAVSLWNKNCQ